MKLIRNKYTIHLPKSILKINNKKFQKYYYLNYSSLKLAKLESGNAKKIIPRLVMQRLVTKELGKLFVSFR